MKRGAMFCLFLLAAHVLFAQKTKELTIESIFAEGGLLGRTPESVQWSPDETKLSFVQRGNSGAHGTLYYIDLANGKKGILVPEDKLSTLAPPLGQIPNERERETILRHAVASYHWSPDSKHLLFASRTQLWFYSLDTGTAVQLTSAADPGTEPKFSPDGSRVAYVRDHNLYALPVNGKEEKALTKDKDENVLNGEVDWVYQEELYVGSNYFWSPDGRQIAFLQMDERNVPTYPISDLGPVHPVVDQQKYPNAGDPNPQVRVGIVSADGGKTRWISAGEPQDGEYIPRFGWVRPGLIYLELLNRAQNKLELWFADASTGHARKILTESEPEAWVPIEHERGIYFLKSGDGFLWTSWRDGYRHIYLYRFDKKDPLDADTRLERQVTKGDFDVESVQAVDEAKNLVFFVANADDPRQRQIYTAALDGSSPMIRVSTQPGTHEANFSRNARYYVDDFSATMTPPQFSLCKIGGTCSTFWQARSVAEYDLIEPKRLELTAADGKTTLYGTLLLPPGSASAKIPLINNPYGGPGVQTVLDSWGGSLFLFDQVLAHNGFAVLHVDNRGMAGRGKNFATATMYHFGEVELADQSAAVQQVLASYPQLDPSRVGWWGWSYGGYLTLYAMTHSNQIKSGVAVAPVTNWLDYDSIYTERYMGLPKDHQESYKKSSPIYYASDLQGRLLEVHGTGDDNVHLQNTIEMIRNLIDAGIQFDLQLYPGKTHDIAGPLARTHLFYRILDHFQHWLQNPVPAASGAAK